MSTYQDMITDAAAILRGPNIETLLLIYAKQAIRDFQKNPISPIYEGATSANVAVVGAALEGNLPADYGRAISAKFAGEKLPLFERHPRVFFELGYPDNSDNFSGTPTEFAVYGAKLIINGVFSADKNCAVRYSPWVPAPATAAEVFPYSESAYDVVLSRMVYLGMVDQRDESGKADWLTLYGQRLNEYLGVKSKQSDASQFSKTMNLTR